MKRKLLSIMTVSVLLFTACSDKEGDGDGVDNGEPVELTELLGSITSKNAVVKGSSINLVGATIVREGATLTIPGGTTITANDKGAYLLIERGAKIIAKGTAAKPIKFTAGDKKSGAWGGLIINGKAPLSRATEASPSNFETEINTNIFYGGNDVNDNSGELDYITIEYSGANISDDKEHNGLTLNGVGKGTKISNIYIKDGADDGIEFFGGSVDVTNLLVVNSEDDMFDFTQGYTGTLKNAYGIWETAFKTNEKDPRGIEADGNHDGTLPDAVHQSNFKIEGMTIVHKSTTAGVEGTMVDIVKIRRGATANITNLLIDIGTTSLFSDIIDFTDDAGKGNAASKIEYTFNPETLYSDAKVKAEGATITKNDAQTGATTSAFAWTGYSFN
ncbi:hypothetical protein G5B30_13670 [Sphingobacterium sp. SGG-5]|uniref:hypothetical protein n=1 Tax=Sphingobacterium sp. SGG-5 TaxID=2710881 RepID=UPI0013EC7AB6|nr:hypothetical protein [Sphingobacterium sp. SGG-5]NGM62955.1 hypothetical protein [Sphingobacterium sp. SGG-5]